MACEGLIDADGYVYSIVLNSPVGGIEPNVLTI